MKENLNCSPQIGHLVYYIANIPPASTTVPYSHSYSLPEYAEVAELITDTQPPSEIVDRYDAHHLLDQSDKRGNIGRARRIIAKMDPKDSVYVTSFQYAPVLSGFLSDLPWVVDVYDDPLQYALNNPRTYHEVTARLDKLLISRADRVAAVLHPGISGIGGENVRWIPNDTGFPVSSVNADTRQPNGPLRAVWAGSPRLNRGIEILLSALGRVDQKWSVDVYGDASDAVHDRVRTLGLEDTVELHGVVEHRTVLDAIVEADVGLCVLPPRRDWVYSYPVKLREYLAGGTIPVLSDFPSFRQSAREAGIYVEPTTEDLAAALRELADADPECVARMKEWARKRAETYPVEVGRRWWARQALHGVRR